MIVCGLIFNSLIGPFQLAVWLLHTASPLVGVILGKVFNCEPLLWISVAGLLIVIIGAWLTRLPEKQSAKSSVPAR